MKSKCFLTILILVTLFSSMVLPIAAVSTTVVIGEFRTHGPSGANDEFVELYNLSSSSVDISGWKLNGSNNAGTTSTRATIPSSTTLQPYQHYLLTNSNTNGYSGATTGNQTYGTGFTDDGGLALLNASNVIVDQVGMSSGSAYKEGTVLSPTTTDKNQSYARKPDTLSAAGGHKNATDTDDNASDFSYNDGSSSPENASSPTAITLRTLTAHSPARPWAAALPLLALMAAAGWRSDAAVRKSTQGRGRRRGKRKPLRLESQGLKRKR